MIIKQKDKNYIYLSFLKFKVHIKNKFIFIFKSIDVIILRYEI